MAIVKISCIYDHLRSRISYKPYINIYPTLWSDGIISWHHCIIILTHQIMTKLPLFPLNTILFPGMPLSLHIFEERYKQMMNHCIEQEKPFGVVLIKKGREAGGPAVPHSIGCTADIKTVEPLRDGRLNLVSTGNSRFEIVDLQYDQPYLVGEVKELQFDTTLAKEDKINAWYLRKIIKNYVDVLSNIGKIEVDLKKFPRDPIELAYLGATILQAPNEQKQKLLEIESAGELIKTLYDACRKEINILRRMLEPVVPPHTDGPFSLN